MDYIKEVRQSSILVGVGVSLGAEILANVHFLLNNILVLCYI